MVRTKAQTDLHDAHRLRPHARRTRTSRRTWRGSGRRRRSAELALKCAPAEPHPEVFDALEDGLDALDRAAADVADAAALSACWRLVVALGFEPALDRVRGVRRAGGGRRGLLRGAGRGAVPRRTGATAARPHDARARPTATRCGALLDGRWPEPPLDARHAAAHRRLLMTFIRHHLAEDRPLPALAFWDRESWNATSS